MHHKTNPSYSAIPTSQQAENIIEDYGWLGWKVLFHLSYDAWLLILSKSVRLFSYGFLAVMLMIYLQTLNFQDNEIGLLFTLTLLGDAVISIFLTSHADHWGRKTTLLIGAYFS